MVQTVQYGSAFDPANLFVDDVYFEAIPPQAYFGGAPTQVGATFGTGSWGPLNKPILCSTPKQVFQNYYGITAAALTDVHDLCTAVIVAMTQNGGTSGIGFYATRLSDGTDAKASYTFRDTAGTPASCAVGTAVYSGIAGNLISVVLSAGYPSGHITATVVPFAGGGTPEVFPDLAGGSSFWNAFADAINNGLSLDRPKSKWITIGSVSSGVAPALGQFFLAGGTDGRGVDAGDLLGSDSFNPTGIYTLENVEFAPSCSWIAGGTDMTTAPNIEAFADQNNLFFLLGMASNTDVDDAVTAKLTTGIVDYNIAFCYDWHWIYDQYNKRSRLVCPSSAMGGAITALPPWESPFNKKLIIQGTERVNQASGTPYGNAEIASLNKAGILFASNPVPGGSYFGFRNGYNSIGNKLVNSYVEYSRLTNFLAASSSSILGQYEGMLQGTAANDPVRTQVKTALNGFYEQLKSRGFIDNYSIICNKQNNTDETIAEHQLTINQLVRYKASIMTIFNQLQGGTTVATDVNVAGAQLAS